MVGVTAAVGIGLAGLGTALSASSANKASKRAAQTSQQNTNANNALALNIYGQNKAALSPYQPGGIAATNQINAMLGLGGQQQPQAQQAQVMPNALAQWQGGQPAGAGYGIADGQKGLGSHALMGGESLPDWGGYRATSMPGSIGGYNGGTWNVDGTQATTGGNGTPAQTPQQAAEGAFDVFRNSTGYQFRLGQGMNALNSGYAGAGTLQSGAAMKSALEYGQNFASNEFGNYMGLLNQQQGVGLQAAGAQAGVGLNYQNAVMNSNNMNAANQANAQLAKQNVFGNALGMVGGGLFQYGKG